MGRSSEGRLVWNNNNIILLLLFLFFFCWVAAPCLCRELDDDAQIDVGENKCIEEERMALLAVRADIGGIDEWLSSWEREDDCCHWEGVGCDDQIGHVVKLDLRYPRIGLPEDKSKLNPSLLNLTSLKHLDLSNNDFGGAQIPGFIGSLVHLEDLNLSYTGFAGLVPRQLGALHNLHSLDLSILFRLKVENLRWLSRLTHLQYLDMSGVDLSAATNWFQVINMLLPSLHGTIPDSFGNMKHLEVLYLTGVGFEGVLPRSLWALDKLKLLHLSCGNLRLGLHDDMAKLSNLQELELEGINGRISASLGSLIHLQSLRLDGNNITGGIPESLGRLANLKHLALYNIYGWIPESLGNLSHLESLDVESRGNLVNLKVLDFSGGNISRGLLRSMGHLCNLTRLLLSGNMARGAKVNELIEGLSQCTGGSALEYLNLRGNGFGGHLPDQVGQLKNLQVIILSGTSIVGSIPASIGELKSLRTLYLSGNKLSGHVPSNVGKLSNVTYLDMSSNRLEGVISEAHFANLSRLERLNMSSNPALSLNISWAWIPPFQMYDFSMRGCSVGPEFPRWLQTQKKLLHLDLSSNVISQSLPYNFFHSFPYHFPFQSLPDTHSLNPSLVPIPHSLSGTIHVYGGDFQLVYLDLSQNSINGKIPSSVCQIKTLKVLDLSYNYLTGEIPRCWENSSLVIMKLSHNNLSGPIPSSPWMLPELTSLHLDKNNLVGVIPPFLKYSTQLETLDLGENHLLGVIPAWLGESLSSLQVLRLRSNMFYGTIPTSLSQLQQLRILDLACNKLSGNLHLSFDNFSAMVEIEKTLGPSLFYNISPVTPINFEESIRIILKGNELEYTKTLPLVTIIDLSNNSLSGHIPEEITCLKGLRFLILSRNHLEGIIPASISTMVLLESLDLSFNQLSGNIPLSLSTIHFLSHFNVSYNDLNGRIPSGSQLQTFDQSSYIGNPSLCGSPLLRHCPDDVISKDPILQPSEEHEDKHEPYKIWLYIGMGTGFAIGFWGFFGMLLAMEKKRVAYFRFIDYVADELYVMVVIHFARLKLKISSWMRG